jgi:voltage-gated potassium channel
MRATTAYRRLRREVHDVLEVAGDAHPMGRVVNGFIIILIFLNAIAFAADTVPELAGRYRWEFAAFNAFSVIVFTVEYALRIWSAVEIPMLSRLPRWQARLRYAMRPMMIIDLLAFLPWYLHWLYPLDLRLLRVFRLFRLLMLVRYSPALQTLGRVVTDEYRALLGALLVILILLLFASSGMYLIERHMQPDKFGSIPQAAWWALATLTTVGYGDVVPVTPLGKMLGGVVMLLGVGMIALPVAIIATGFSQESTRHQFVVTLGHDCPRAAVRLHGLQRDRRDHQGALHPDLYARRAHSARERRWRCDVHHCQRRGGRRDQPRAACASEGRRLLRRDGAARTSAT